MIIKKAFVTTSSFLITAVLLSQIYTYKRASDQSNSINYSAFINLVENIKGIRAKAPESIIANENSANNEDIIKLINREITQKIIKTRYAIRPIIEEKIIAKIEAPQIIIQAVVAEDLSSYEINNSELINLYALTVEEMAISKFESISVTSANNEFIKDEVVMAQASTKSVPLVADEITTTQPIAEVSPSSEVPEKEDEEMVMFDYSNKPGSVVSAKTIDQTLYERPISKTVQQAIRREIGNVSSVNIATMNTQRKMPEVAVQNFAKADNQEGDLNSEANAFSAPALTLDSQFIIKAQEINLSTQKNHQAIAFEFVPDYDRAERKDDQGSGEIALGYSLSGDMNTQTGVVQAQGMISTRVELNLGGKVNFEIPLINEEGMQTFLQKQGLTIEGNLIMLAIDPLIVDTELDSKFQERFFFDKNFLSLSSADGASFVMYAGVKSGNIMIRYLLSNKESAQKIVYVGDGEMYYEDASFVTSNRETFTFTTRNLLGQKRKELIIDGGAISYFNTNITAKKKALNAYDMKIPTLASGMRKYLEFKHLKENIFVGASSIHDIEIPSNEFIGKVLEVNQVNSLKDRCVVQINLSKDLREIKVNGKNRSGEMFVETSFLDGDGNFSQDSSEMAEKAFVVGDLEGQFNVKLDYADGSTEFLKTFCTEGSYLVEQL